MCGLYRGMTAGQTYLIIPDSNSRPISISSINIYFDPDCTEEIFSAWINQTVHVELNGSDGDPEKANVALIYIISNKTVSRDLQLRLYETGPDTGIYRGSFTIKDKTHGSRRWIGTSYGDHVTISSTKDPAIMTSVLINKTVLKPDTDNLIAQEDELYSEHYWAENGIVANWIFNTNASWLSWDPEGRIISGTPNNSHVGTYWVKIGLQDIYLNIDERNFTLEVLNTNDPPEFTSEPVLVALVNMTYTYNVNASDIDKNDDLHYSLEKKPEGMEIDPLSGQITWTPTQDQKGEQDVIVEVNDPIVTIEQTIKINVHPHLSVTINNPSEGQKVSGMVTASGTVQGPEGKTIEIRIDDSKWKTINESQHWKYEINTREFEDGEHTIKVRALWDRYRTDEQTVNVLVDNRKEASIDGTWIMWPLILLLLFIALILLFRGNKKDIPKNTRKKKVEEEE